MARDMGPSEIHRPPSWLSGSRTDVPTLIGPDYKDESVIALFNFKFSIFNINYSLHTNTNQNVKKMSS